jgi:hypothetical protein
MNVAVTEVAGVSTVTADAGQPSLVDFLRRVVRRLRLTATRQEWER